LSIATFLNYYPRSVAVTIKVDGKTVPVTATSGEGIDLLQDTAGKVERGRYVEIV